MQAKLWTITNLYTAAYYDLPVQIWALLWHRGWSKAYNDTCVWFLTIWKLRWDNAPSWWNVSVCYWRNIVLGQMKINFSDSSLWLIFLSRNYIFFVNRIIITMKDKKTDFFLLHKFIFICISVDYILFLVLCVHHHLFLINSHYIPKNIILKVLRKRRQFKLLDKE